MQKNFLKYCSTKISRKLYNNRCTSYYAQGFSTTKFYLLFNGMAKRKCYLYVDKLYKLQKGQHKLLLTQAAKLEVWVSSKPCIENQLKTLLPDASK